MRTIRNCFASGKLELTILATIQTVRSSRSNSRGPAQAPSFVIKIVSDDFSTRQPTCQPALNGEFGSNRDANEHAGGAKSRLLKRVASVLRWRNSLCMAI